MRIFLVFMIVISLTTCTKFGKNVTVEGKIINPVNGTGIPDVKVQLLRSTSGIPGGYKEVKSVYTDENGEFTMDRLSLKKVYLQAQTDGNYYDLGWLMEDGSYEQTTGLYSVKKGKKTHAEFHAVPYGKYAISVRNVNCGGVNDTIIITQKDQVKSFLDTEWILTGCQDYTTAYSNVPMGSLTIKWTVIRAGVSNFYTDEVFLNEGETLLYQLDY